MFDDFETEVQCEEMFNEIEAWEAMQLEELRNHDDDVYDGMVDHTTSYDDFNRHDNQRDLDYLES